MQFVVKVLGSLLQALMGTTAGESLNAAGNIFIGQVFCATCIGSGVIQASDVHVQR